MVFGSGLDCSPDEAEEQESYMMQPPSLSTLVLAHPSHKIKLTMKQKEENIHHLI